MTLLTFQQDCIVCDCLNVCPHNCVGIVPDFQAMALYLWLECTRQTRKRSKYERTSSFFYFCFAVSCAKWDKPNRLNLDFHSRRLLRKSERGFVYDICEKMCWGVRALVGCLVPVSRKKILFILLSHGFRCNETVFWESAKIKLYSLYY